MLDGHAHCSHHTGTKVWAKLKGYPWWPGQIADQAAMPEAVQAAKRHPTCVPILFYGSDDYGWVQPSDVKLLGDESVTPKRQGKVLEALKIAENDMSPTGRIGHSIGAGGESERDTYGACSEWYEDEDASTPVNKAETRTSISKSKETPASRPSKRKPKHSLNEHDGFKGSQVGDGRESLKRRKNSANEESRIKRSPYERLMHHRHRVQKMMKDCPELLGESAKIGEIISDLERFPMTLELLKETKVGKLMKRLTQQEFPDGNNIKERSAALIRMWTGEFQLHKERDTAGNESRGTNGGTQPDSKSEPTPMAKGCKEGDTPDMIGNSPRSQRHVEEGASEMTKEEVKGMIDTASRLAGRFLDSTTSDFGAGADICGNKRSDCREPTSPSTEQMSDGNPLKVQIDGAEIAGAVDSRRG